MLCMCRAAEPEGEHPAHPDPKAGRGGRGGRGPSSTSSPAERLEAELVRWLRNAQQVRRALWDGYGICICICIHIYIHICGDLAVERCIY